MSLTDQEIETLAVRFFALPGFIKEHESDFILEDNGPGQSYIKFMSDHGKTDEHNGTVVCEYMVLNGAANLRGGEGRFLVAENSELRKIFNL